MTSDPRSRMPAGKVNNSYTGGMLEAGSPTTSSFPASAIAGAIAARWNEEVSPGVEMLAPTFLYVHQHRLLETVFDSANEAEAALEVLRKARKSGVNVAVILPIAELGRAHDALWGTGLTLHGWVEHGDGSVRFTGPEVA